MTDLRRDTVVKVLTLERDIILKEIAQLEAVEKPTASQRTDLRKYRIYLDDNRASAL